MKLEQIEKLEELETRAVMRPWRLGSWAAQFGTMERIPDSIEHHSRLTSFPGIRHSDDDCRKVVAIEDFESSVSIELIVAMRNALPELLALARWAIQTAKPALEDIFEMEEHCSTDTRKSFLQEDCERALAAFPEEKP